MPAPAFALPFHSQFDYYGAQTPLRTVANISTPESTLLVVQVRGCCFKLLFSFIGCVGRSGGDGFDAAGGAGACCESHLLIALLCDQQHARVHAAGGAGGCCCWEQLIHSQQEILCSGLYTTQFRPSSAAAAFLAE